MPCADIKQDERLSLRLVYGSVIMAIKDDRCFARLLWATLKRSRFYQYLDSIKTKYFYLFNSLMTEAVII